VLGLFSYALFRPYADTLPQKLAVNMTGVPGRSFSSAAQERKAGNDSSLFCDDCGSSCCHNHSVPRS
jgi:hypothetical protein